MISYKCVASCSRRIFSVLLNLDAVRTNNIKSLHVKMKRPCVALPSRYTCCAPRHDQFYLVNNVRCSGRHRFYCDIPGIKDDWTAHNKDITGSPVMSLPADPQNNDLRRSKYKSMATKCTYYVKTDKSLHTFNYSM